MPRNRARKPTAASEAKANAIVLLQDACEKLRSVQFDPAKTLGDQAFEMVGVIGSLSFLIPAALARLETNEPWAQPKQASRSVEEVRDAS